MANAIATAAARRRVFVGAIDITNVFPLKSETMPADCARSEARRKTLRQDLR
jgi:hypothetical protein